MRSRLVLGLFALLCACNRESTAPEGMRPPSPREAWIQGIGLVEPAGEVRRLTFLHPGIIGEVLVKVGQQVEPGTVLMRQTNREESAALTEAEAALAVAKAEYAQVVAGVNPERIRALEASRVASEATATNARSDFERIERLSASGVASDTDREHTKTELLRADANLKQIEAELANLRFFVRDEEKEVAKQKIVLAESRVAMARARLTETELRATVPGRVLEILHREGEPTFTVTPEPVLIFADASQLRVRAEIEETYALELVPGQEAEVYGRGLGDRKISGRVTFVKSLMGKKTVFTKTSTERKDVDVLQVMIDLPANTILPIGFETDVRIKSVTPRESQERMAGP